MPCRLSKATIQIDTRGHFPLHSLLTICPAHILCISHLNEKAKGALGSGVKLVVAPRGNESQAKVKARKEEAETGQAPVDWNKVVFAENVVDLLEHTVKGELIQLYGYTL